jgi:hypothetical protein
MGLAAAALVALVVSGCSTSTASNNRGPRWLVRVNGDFANVYAYPAGNKPKEKRAVELGLTFTNKELNAAAARIGVPPGNVSFVATR